MSKPAALLTITQTQKILDLWGSRFNTPLCKFKSSFSALCVCVCVWCTLEKKSMKWIQLVWTAHFLCHYSTQWKRVISFIMCSWYHLVCLWGFLCPEMMKDLALTKGISLQMSWILTMEVRHERSWILSFLSFG